jgi:hypothetical protein
MILRAEGGQLHARVSPPAWADCDSWVEMLYTPFIRLEMPKAG